MRRETLQNVEDKEKPAVLLCFNIYQTPNILFFQ